MLKKIFIALAIIFMIAIVVVYIYRHAIIQYYATKIIRENLPNYIKIDKINFDFAGSRISLGDFKVLNPPGFSSGRLIKIKSINCKYKILGLPIPKGLEITEVSFNGADIEIERLKDSHINVLEAARSAQGESIPVQKAQIAENRVRSAEGVKKNTAPGVKISDIIKLPPSFGIKNARIAFMDRQPYDKPHIITADSINGDVAIEFDDNYTKILGLSFTLEGNLNESSDEVIKWAASLNPLAPRLTMSNRFEVSGLDILAFEPYYDRFSPFVFRKGRFSGTLVFDFDSGNIGSTNEVRLSDLEFFVKPGYENAQMWETNVPDLMKYFTTNTGDIVFDFKLKGDMANPQFYLGPISKRALTSMAIDKMASYAVDQMSKQGGNASKTVDKAKEYIDVFKGMLNKK